jgi:glycosyltransferase involved in cell wall biosynthesis
MRLALGRSCRVPRVFQVPGPLHLEHRFFRSAELATACNSDVWIGSCRWTCNRYRTAGVVPERVFLSYYGTDLEQFMCHEGGILRRELGVIPEAKLVGMVAYMYAPKRHLGESRGLKGHEDLIDSIAIALKTIPTLRGVIIGGAWNGAIAYEQRVRAYAQQRCGDRIVFLGTRQDVPQLYPDLDVVVHPSLSENVGGAVESLLMGRPTIATDVGGFPDLVKNNETGWLVPPRAPEQLAQTIVHALLQPDKGAAFAHQGQNLARHLFDVKRTAQEIAEIYSQLLDRQGAAA